MFCHNCGIQRIPGAKFCPNCGCALPDPAEFLNPSAPAPQPIPSPGEIGANPPAIPTAPAALEAIPAIPIPPTPPMGYAPPPYPFPPMEPVLPQAPPKQGRHRVPLIIMAAMVLVGLLLFFISPIRPSSGPADATAPDVSDTPWFRNEEGTLYFDPALYTGPAELTVPETVDGQSVVCISEDCFAGNTTLTTVILPDTLEEIGSGAFSGCTAMRGIFIPEGVKLIGSGAFRDCASLEAICISASVEAIGYNAFRGCIRLDYVLYDGTYRDWCDLYSGSIPAGTTVYCTDGTYPHGSKRP